MKGRVDLKGVISAASYNHLELLLWTTSRFDWTVLTKRNTLCTKRILLKGCDLEDIQKNVSLCRTAKMNVLHGSIKYVEE